MSETKTYTCDSPVNHDGKLYAIGAPIDLTDDAAESLLALGRISAPPANPVPSNVVNLGDAKKGAGEADTGTPAGAGDEPTDPVVRQAAIKVAIASLDREDESLWLKSGAPDAKAVTEVLGWKVTAAERDEVWGAQQDA